MPNTAKLLLLTATSLEAQPLIQRYRLRRQHDYHHFPVFHCAKDNIWLIESGIGSLAAASAVSALFHVSQASAASVCLNIGIAGGSQEIGSTWQINKITDKATQSRYYPSLLKGSQLPSIAIQTLPQASNQYQSDCLFDMESSGFYASANRFLVNEQIGLLKIVSDNHQCDHKQLKKKQIKQLLEQREDQIISFCDHWQQHAKHENCFHQLPSAYSSYLDQFHFTTYQQHELKRLLQQWQALYPERPPEEVTVSCNQAKAVLQMLHSELDQAPNRW